MIILISLIVIILIGKYKFNSNPFVPFNVYNIYDEYNIINKLLSITGFKVYSVCAIFRNNKFKTITIVSRHVIKKGEEVPYIKVYGILFAKQLQKS